MKKIFAAGLIIAAGYAASAQQLKFTPSTEKDDVEAPEITELFEKNFPELGPMKWRKLSQDSINFYLISIAITKEQNDINQSVRVIGVDNGDGVYKVSEIKNIGIDGDNQKDRGIREDLFIETKQNGWSLTKTYRTEGDVKRDTRGRRMTVQMNDKREIIYFIDNSMGFGSVLDTAKGLLHPTPKKTAVVGTNEL